MSEFDRYYQEVYLPLHQNTGNIILHFIGTILSFLLALTGIITLSPLLLLISLFVVYPFAWAGHFFLEKNKPAAWSNPVYARLSDWRMCIDLLSGKL